jgi:Heterokaryon incompatibility protein (HET)
MRLLDTSAYKLHEFSSDEIPDYAILSHRWEEEEISLHDLENGRYLKMAGFAKLKGCCAQATLDNFRYVWIDTCCIDKTSSAELSEAINSMYQWYQNAAVCYAYLSDTVKDGIPNRYLSPNKHFTESKWFTRGWTLQELLAPPFVVFYDHLWNEIGTKFSLEPGIACITGIKSLAHADRACIAEKMSWASRRETTRVEDMAYCLMGLFGVHMAPLYGEGHNAFIRLQLEIISNSDDESIFAWTSKSSRQSGLLASSPKEFKFSGDIELLPFDKERPQYSITNKGLRLELFLTQVPDSADSQLHSVEYLAPLNCGRRSKSQDSTYPVALRLRQHDQNQYSRIHLDNLELERVALEPLKREVVYVKQPSGSESNIQATSETPIFFVSTASILKYGFWISEIFSLCQTCSIWNTSDVEKPTLTMYTTPFCSFHEKNYGALLFSKEGSAGFAVVLELSDHKYPGADLLVQHWHHPLKYLVEDFIEEQAQSRLNLRLDRVSKPMLGRSVSLALRGVGKQQYLVDIDLVSR